VPYISSALITPLESAKYILPALAVGGITALVVIPALISVQRARNVGQHVYDDGPKAHASKEGTPTMGGLAFLAALLISAAGLLSFMYWNEWPDSQFWRAAVAEVIPLTCLAAAVGLIGFADDFLIVMRRRPLGLRARWKFSLLTVAAAGYIAWAGALAGPYRSLGDQYFFGLSVTLPSWAVWVLGIVAIVGAANAVNLTDGLDGLAAGTSVPVLAVLMLIPTVWQSRLIVASVLGAVIVFAFFNRHPARIFMGDTGSLMLGALMAAFALQNGTLLMLPIVGIVFVAEALSVIAQVVSFKTTGKRIIKMSPLHHHFELSGWSEARVVNVFSLASVIAGVTVYFGWLAASGGLK
jgi:phospho-N-acetylmuramoyl-pentapeptide-transferase